MANRYYSEFDFYRKLLDIISNDSSNSRKLSSIKSAIYQQFFEFNKLIKSHRVTVRFDGDDYYD